MNPQPKPPKKKKMKPMKQERRKMKPITVVANVLLNSTIGEREQRDGRENVVEE